MTMQDEAQTGSNGRSIASVADGAAQRSPKRLSPANDAATVEPIDALLSIAKLLGRREGARLTAQNDNCPV